MSGKWRRFGDALEQLSYTNVIHSQLKFNVHKVHAFIAEFFTLFVFTLFASLAGALISLIPTSFHHEVTTNAQNYYVGIHAWVLATTLGAAFAVCCALFAPFGGALWNGLVTAYVIMRKSGSDTEEGKKNLPRYWMVWTWIIHAVVRFAAIVLAIAIGHVIVTSGPGVFPTSPFVLPDIAETKVNTAGDVVLIGLYARRFTVAFCIGISQLFWLMLSVHNYANADTPDEEIEVTEGQKQGSSVSMGARRVKWVNVPWLYMFVVMTVLFLFGIWYSRPWMGPVQEPVGMAAQSIRSLVSSTRWTTFTSSDVDAACGSVNVTYGPTLRDNITGEGIPVVHPGPTFLLKRHSDYLNCLYALRNFTNYRSRTQYLFGSRVSAIAPRAVSGTFSVAYNISLFSIYWLEYATYIVGLFTGYLSALIFFALTRNLFEGEGFSFQKFLGRRKME